MGGDRDGNPNVTPSITKIVILLSRLQAAKLFKADMRTLYEELSVRSASKELQGIAKDEEEPYRKIIAELEDRLEGTIDWCYSKLN